MEIFQNMEGLALKRVEIHVEVQNMEIFQDLKIILDMKIILHTKIILYMEDNHHKLLHS